MRLARVRIDGFKCLMGIDWRPAPGLNLVLGPDEAGKSSLAEFLEAMIFGLPGGAGAEHLRPWSGGKFGGRRSDRHTAEGTSLVRLRLRR